MVSVLPFPSNSTTDSCSTSSPWRLRFSFSSFNFKPSNPIPSRFLKQKPLRFPSLNILASSSLIEDGSAQEFLDNNSIADFMRFKRGSRKGSAQLQTAVVSYKKKFPWSLLPPFLQVDLVSTIHIADKEYFETLQKELEDYDGILYEMVASRESLENRRNPADTKKLRNLDYETFKLLQLEKGESFFTFARDMTLKSTKAMVQPSIPEDLGPWRSKLLWASRVLPMPLVGLLIIGSVCTDVGSQPSEYPELEALSRLDFGAAMKVFLAKRLTSEFTQVTADVEESSVIIGERNRAAIEALRRAIDEGHSKIAILYGGGHMPDLSRRLREEFDLFPSQVQWITAWSIRNRDLNSSSLPFLKTMAEVLGWPLNRYQTLALLIFSSVLALDLWFWELFFGTTVDWISQIASEVYQYVDNALMM
ncbi:hypothetical protein Patl1_13245 [Pistacia atlantica]|uniref:Uncharacterized protein n=1 Tax=Pistacia atlantica TaxID=434234 RepID=A0ACC1ATG8_9ROSI|nr:hypothetical protein Patl1_13245 [Pistacia atlantica]